MGFKAAKADPCLYIKGSGNSKVLLLVFVDDLCVICKEEGEIEQTIKDLHKEFKLRYLGKIKNYLGVEVEHLPGGGYKLSQKAKIEQLVQRYKMEGCKPVKALMELSYQKGGDAESPEFSEEIYRSLIGSLQYLGNWGRSDILAATGLLSRHVEKPTRRHWQASKRILRYLKGSRDWHLTIKPENGLKLTAYVDVDWAPDITTRQSISGHVICLGGVVIGWRSIRQKYMFLSLTEYRALSLLCSELTWYKQLVSDMGVEVQGPIVVNEDNEACITMVKSQRART
ncbi:uncharacterized protein [Tiliqua scincoides]|uniref:uncharacterized protein n=1 Tax=Tiliqua scincoides TaxID=71010 RepID=UPI0034629DE4